MDLEGAFCGEQNKNLEVFSNSLIVRLLPFRSNAAPTLLTKIYFLETRF